MKKISTIFDNSTLALQQIRLVLSISAPFRIFNAICKFQVCLVDFSYKAPVRASNNTKITAKGRFLSFLITDR